MIYEYKYMCTHAARWTKGVLKKYFASPKGYLIFTFLNTKFTVRDIYILNTKFTVHS